MIKKHILFVSSDLSRGLVLLARTLSKQGYSVAIASPNSNNTKYLLDIPHFALPCFRVFKKQFMFKTGKLKEYINQTKPVIHTLDNWSDKLLKDYKHFNRPVDFGLDLDIYNPTAVSIPRQTQFLNEYNIAPHQKLITVISPLDVKLGTLLSALKQLERDDYIIALLGTTGRMRAKKISDAIHKNNFSGNIILAGIEQDLPSLFRTSYATISLGNHSERLLKMAVAMGRPLLGTKNAYDIIPNITIDDTQPETIASALKTVLDLSTAKRDDFAKQNILTAKKFCIHNTVKDCLNLYKIS